jgi:alpha-glucoside transport system permease protein
MTTTTPVMAPVPPQERKLSRAERRAVAAKTKLSSPAASIIAIVIAVLWTVPTFGLLVTSFRPELDIRRSGWWTAFSDPQFTLDNYN